MNESLSDRIKRLKAQTDSFVKDHRITTTYSKSMRLRKDIAATGKFTYQAYQGLSWIKQWIVDPLNKQLLKVWRWGSKYYIKLWNWIVFRRVEDNVYVFSKSRAGMMILATGLFGWYLLLPVLEVLVDCPVYLLTVNHNERLYLWSPQEVNHHTNSQLLRGCPDSPCTEDNALYFRVENTLFNNLWSLAHGHGLFFPEYVASVPGSITECSATSYWFRFRITSRILNIYPHMLSVSCLGAAKPNNHVI